MASEYGLNFGFRVSDETRRSSFGRVRTPKTGAALLMGTAVEQDPANPGYLRVKPAATPFRTGASGLLVQEEEWDRTIYQSDIIDSFSYGVAKHNRLSVITSGPGTKVWFRNTAGQTRADGRVIPAVTMFLTTSGGATPVALAVGVGLGWDGTRWVPAADPTAATSLMEVTYYDASAGLVEAFLTK